MEQPAGSLDDLQPQDLSTCSIPAVIDLTRKSEECVLNSNSLEALRMVKNPGGWYPNSGSGKTTGLPFTDAASSDIGLPSGDEVQPDNAFSSTTVTFSYVSRSHVFSAHDSLPQHTPLYGVPSIGKFSLHPAPYESEMELRETGCALSQHYIEQVDGPLDLAAQTELLQSLSQAQVGNENTNGVCLTQQSHELNGGVVSGDVVDEREHSRGEVERSLSLDTESSADLQDCRGNSWSNSGTGVESSPEPLVTNTGECQETMDPAVLFLISRTQELCSLSREFISPLDDPVSPSATSLDDVEHVFILPQASSSPSADNSFPGEADNTAWEVPDRPLVSAQSTMSSSDSMPTLDTRSEHKTHRRKAPLEPMIDLTLTDDNDFLTEDLEKKPTKTAAPHLNGNAKAVQATFQRKQLPPRPGRGTRLEAIVMNIHPGRYRVAASVKKAKVPQAGASVPKVVSPKKDTSVVGKRKSRAKASIAAENLKLQAATPSKRGKANGVNTDGCKESTSDSDIINNSKNSHHSRSPKTLSSRSPKDKTSKEKPEHISHTEPPQKSSPQFHVIKKLSKEPEHIAHTEPSPEPSPQVVHGKSKKKPIDCISPPKPPPETNGAGKPSPPKSPKKSPAEHKSNTAASKKSPPAKTKASTKKKKRKKYRADHSSLFAPKEPEIKLKYVNYKEEKRDSRSDAFSPFVHVERKQTSPALCTVVNYTEEERPRQKKGQQQGHSGGFIAGAVPSTSCLYVGRASNHSQRLGSLVCCLCGESANAMDLGDLHGPYYPEGYKPSTKTQASTPGLKEDEEDSSDSDSSSCSMRGRRKCTRPPAPWSPRLGSKLKQKGLPGGHQSWTSDSDHPGPPATKRARTEPGTAAEEDWYSPPVVPLEPCEYWLHEDCGIWSAGVFLVKGKVYGLEEAVKVAQETMCLGCHGSGATLGCFFKGCPNKYHYRCALETECVLIEDNFSMKCKKHKNKTFRAPPGNRWDDR